MALRNIFKRKPKKTEAEKKTKEKKILTTESPEGLKEKLAEKKTEKTKKGLKKISGQAYRLLREPHITEKTTDLIDKNQYVFKIWPRANKKEIKKAIESLFGVNVINVRIINVSRKKRKLGKIEGFRKGYKKAVIRIKEGQKIEVLPR